MSHVAFPSSPPNFPPLEAHDENADEIAEEIDFPLLNQRDQLDDSLHASSYVPSLDWCDATSDLPSYFSASYGDPARGMKSSSPVPTFSCDAEDAADGSNYNSLHIPKKRQGTWFDDAPTKKTRMMRNFDSGVYMLSDGASSSDSLPHHTAPFAVPVSAPRPSVPEQQRAFEKELDAGLDMSAEIQDFSGLDLVDANIGRIGELDSIIKNLPDRGHLDKGQYRSLVPRLHVDLSNNRLCRLRPALFTLQHLQSLNLVNNNITELPPDIGRLSKLNFLNIGHNPIHWLPYECLALLQGYLTIVGDSVPWIPRPLGLDNALALAHTPAYHPPPRCLARMTVDFFDEAGKPTSAPLCRKGAKSLVTLAIHSALRWRHDDNLDAADLVNTIQTEAHLPCIAHDILAQASKNDLGGGGGDLRECFLCEEQYAVATKHDNGGYGDFRACHECGKEYVVARAEWFEWWSPTRHVVYPLKKKVCSWACVPDAAMASALTGSQTW
jgi:hypothetical protein